LPPAYLFRRSPGLQKRLVMAAAAMGAGEVMAVVTLEEVTEGTDMAATVMDSALV
jgi:hypothetical protein